MRCIDRIASEAAPALERFPGFRGVGALVAELAEAAKVYSETLRSDADIFDVWTSVAVAHERLRAFPPDPLQPSNQRGRIAAAIRQMVGEQWLCDARAEYASVASFLRLALELAELKAPASRLYRAYLAAHQEAAHARACFALAASYLGLSKPFRAPHPACKTKKPLIF